MVRLQGNYARAHALYDVCLVIFQATGDSTGVAWTMNYLGDLTREPVDSIAARSYYEQSLSVFRQLGDGWGIASALCDLARLSAAQSKHQNAERPYGESITIFQGLGHKRGIARVLECFAVSAAAQSRPEKSLRLAGATAALRQRIGAPLIPAEQSRLEKKLGPARDTLTNAAGLLGKKHLVYRNLEISEILEIVKHRPLHVPLEHVTSGKKQLPVWYPIVGSDGKVALFPCLYLTVHERAYLRVVVLGELLCSRHSLFIPRFSATSHIAWCPPGQNTVLWFSAFTFAGWPYRRWLHFAIMTTLIQK